MKIISWNVNGIRAAVKNGFMAWFKKTMPDILCIQEVKAQEDSFPKEFKNIKDYNFYFSAAQKKGYAGTAIWTKQKPLQAIKKIGVTKFDAEGRFLFLEYPKFYLFNTYFPQSQRELARLKFKTEFNQAYLRFIKKFKNKPIILTGDFNVAHRPIDLANPKQNEKNAGFTQEEREFADQLLNQGYIDTFRRLHPKKVAYTWWTYRFNARARNMGWRIDYFFVIQDFIKNVKKAEVHDQIMGSDHCPVSLEIRD